MRRELRSLTQIRRRPAEKQRCRRIHYNQCPRFVFTLTRQHRANDPGIRFGITTAQVLDRSNLKPKIVRRDLKSFHFPTLRFRDVRLARERDLIQSIFTMHNPRTLSPEPDEHVRQLLAYVLVPYTDDLPRRTCRITQRSQQVERRMDAKLSSNARHSRSRSVIERREHEA